MSYDPIQFIWSYAKRYPLCLIIFTITSLMAVFEMSLIPYFLKRVVDVVSTVKSSELIASVWFPALCYAGMDLYHNLSMRAYAYASLRMYPGLKKKVTEDLFDYTSNHSLSFFQNNFAGDLAAKIQTIVQNVENILHKPFTLVIGRALIPFVAGFFLMSVSWEFGLIYIFWSLLFIGVTMKLSRGVQTSSKAYASSNNLLQGRLIDVLTNIVTTKIFENSSFEKGRLSSVLDEVKQDECAMHRSLLALHFTQGIMTLTLISIFMTLLIYGRMYDDFSVGDFVFVMGILSMTLPHVYVMGQLIGDLAKEWGQFKQAMHTLILPHEITDSPNASVLEVSQPSIEFRKVDFQYEADTPIFKKMNVRIEPEQKVGIVGFSGGGKSTFINLLMRLYEPQSGQICIDGQDIQTVTRNSLRKQMTQVPQQCDLFHRTILDNIRYGNVEASDEDVIEAAKRAECDEFIHALPQQYDTMVGERGVKLSGGQKQRIALARAYVKQSPILILDEPTSALDTITEQYIQRTLTDMMRGRTTLIVAHRLATLQQMDRILVFKEGAIVEDGTLEDLKRHGAYFKQLWQSQLVDAESH